MSVRIMEMLCSEMWAKEPGTFALNDYGITKPTQIRMLSVVFVWAFVITV